MRVLSWLLLLVSFSMGLISAFVVAYYTFDAKPIEIEDRGPTVKILVAQKEIPMGAEIIAEDIVFENVPIAEIPSKSLTNFMQVYRRRPAYPIPVGCPICEDLLVPEENVSGKAVKYLPAGSQIVSLEVEQFRMGDTVSELEIPISNILSEGETVDIRVVPRLDVKGEYIARKNQVLRAFASKNESSGKLVLENIPIHKLTGKGAESKGKQIQTLSLLLEKGDADKLTEAARDGKLRVLLHRQQGEATVEKQKEEKSREVVQAPAVTENETEAVAEELLAEPTPEVRPEPVREERNEETFAVEKPVRLLDSQTAVMEEFRVDSFDADDLQASTADPISVRSMVATEQTEEVRFETKGPIRDGAHVSFVTPQLKSPVRNDPHVVAAASSLTIKENRETVEIKENVSFRNRAPNRIVEVGLAYEKVGALPVEPLSASSFKSGYSPFNTGSRQLEVEAEEEETETLSQPLPLRGHSSGDKKHQWR